MQAHDQADANRAEHENSDNQGNIAPSHVEMCLESSQSRVGEDDSLPENMGNPFIDDACESESDAGTSRTKRGRNTTEQLERNKIKIEKLVAKFWKQYEEMKSSILQILPTRDDQQQLEHLQIAELPQKIKMMTETYDAMIQVGKREKRRQKIMELQQIVLIETYIRRLKLLITAPEANRELTQQSICINEKNTVASIKLLNNHDNENNAIDRANNNTTNSNATNYAELKYQFDDTFKAVCSMIGENPAFVEMVSRHLAIFARNIRQEVEELSVVNQLQGDGSAFFDGAHAVKHGRANSRRNKAFYERGIRTTLADGHSTKPKGRRRKRKGQVEGNNSGDEFEDTLASQEMEHEKSPKRSRREYDADSTESLSMEQVESNDSEDGYNISAPMAYHRDQLIMQEDDHASQSETPKSLYQQFQSLHTQPLVKSQRRQNLPSRFKDTVSLL